MPKGVPAPFSVFVYLKLLKFSKQAIWAIQTFY